MSSMEDLRSIIREELGQHLEDHRDLRSNIPSLVLIYPADQHYLKSGFISQEWVLKLCCMYPEDEHTLADENNEKDGRTNPACGVYYLKDLGEFTGPIIKWMNDKSKIVKVISPRLGNFLEWVHKDEVTSFIKSAGDKTKDINLPESTLPKTPGKLLPVSSDIIRLAGLNEHDYRNLEGQGLIFLQQIFQKHQPCGNLHLFVHNERMLWLCQEHKELMEAKREIERVIPPGKSERSSIMPAGGEHKHFLPFTGLAPQYSAAETDFYRKEYLQASLPISNIPEVVPDFKGRAEEIKRIKTAIIESSTRLININGIGGIGKTELALSVAHQLHSEFPDGQIILYLRGSGEQSRSALDVLISFIRVFSHRETNLPDDLDEAAGLFRRILSGKRVLLLLEDAADSEQVRPLIPSSGSALIVTSRSPIILPGMERVLLDQLGPDDALDLFHSITPFTPIEPAKQVCRLCGYLPLAVRAAGSLLAITPDLEPISYAKQLHDERTRLERIGKIGINISIEASFNLSYAKLSEDLSKAFAELSVFPGSFDAPAEEVICDDPEHHHLSALVRFGLVGFDRVSRRYRIHELVRLFAASKLLEESRASLEERFASHFQCVLQESETLNAKSGEDHKKGLSLFRLEEDNIRHGRALAKKYSSLKIEAAEVCWLYTARAWNILLRGLSPRELIQWTNDSLNIARQLSDSRGELNPLHLLGLVYQDVGEYDLAVEYFERALQCADDLLEIAIIHQCLGEVFTSLGDLDRAIHYLEWAKDRLCRLGRHDLEGKVIMAMALAHDRNKNTEQAIHILNGLISHAREKGDLLEEANALANLSNISSKRMSLDQAIQSNELALERFRALGFRHWEGQALAQLGNHYSRASRHEEGLVKVQEALAIHRENKDFFREIAAIGILGEIYVRMGNYQEAIRVFDQQHEIACQIGDRKSEANSLACKAQCLKEKDEFRAAIALFNQARQIDQRIGHLDHEIGICCSLGEIYEKLNDRKEALAVYEEEVETAKKMHHVPSIIHAVNHLAKFYEKHGDIERAIQYRMEAYRISSTSGDPHDEPETQFEYASLLARIGRKVEAIQNAEESLTVFERLCIPCSVKVKNHISLWKTDQHQIKE